MVRIGIGQYSPVHFDLKQSLVKLEKIVNEAGSNMLDLLVMGETWLSGYPAWLDHCPDIGRWDYEPMKEIFLRMYENSVSVPGREVSFVCDLARRNQLTICLGVNEIVKHGAGNGTIYNSMIIIGKDGAILNHHRKLVPTFTEKLIYGYGDGAGLQSVDTSYGRIGGSICWEHWMPLSRQALHDSGEDIHLALWPSMNRIHEIASCHYALEGRCYVIAAAQILRAADFPAGLRVPEALSKDLSQLVLRGGSCVIAPDGSFVVEPVFDKELTIICEVDIKKNIRERMTLDTSGHYQRRDVFDFSVDRSRFSHSQHAPKGT
jgi:nitrilase